MKKIQWHLQESNPRPSGLRDYWNHKHFGILLGYDTNFLRNNFTLRHFDISTFYEVHTTVRVQLITQKLSTQKLTLTEKPSFCPQRRRQLAVPVRIPHTYKQEHVTNENYCILVLINIKTCTYQCLVLGNFFWSSTDFKQRVNKKQNVEIDSAASSGGQGKYTKC
jgi:hypothetical protein